MPGETRRVRRIVENGAERFRLTVKRRLSDLTSEEDERAIGRAEYESLLAEANPALRTIRKTRFRVPHEGQVAEFDRYPFWDDRMILEIELDSEAEAARVPEWVLGDPRRQRRPALQERPPRRASAVRRNLTAAARRHSKTTPGARSAGGGFPRASRAVTALRRTPPWRRKS